MINLIKKDLIITYLDKTIFLIFLLTIPFIFFLKGNVDTNTLFLYSVLTSSFISSRSSISQDAVGNSYLFIQSLPITKVDIVVSKYLSIFIHFFIASIFAIISMFVLDNSTPLVIDLSLLKLNAIVLSLLVVILYVSLSMPGEFGFSAKTSSILSTIIYVIFLNLFILGDTPIHKFINMILDYRIITALILTIIYLLSIKLSLVLYENRKLY